METYTFKPHLTGLLLDWYGEHARDLPWRATRDPYAIWLSEIMLQQTQVDTVIPYYKRFLAALPTVEALAAAPEAQVLKLWEGLGYYSRARNLHRCARTVVQVYGGRFPRDWPALRALPGIGDYTAGAILSIAMEQPAAAVDGNVLRVSARLLALEQPMTAPAVKKAVARGLETIYPPPGPGCGAFTQGLMELGATVCIPGSSPRCTACPLEALCCARQRGLAGTLPVTIPKKPKRQEALTVLILRRGGHLALTRRGEGLLGGLWQLPNVPGHPETEEVPHLLESWGLSPGPVGEPYRRSHTFTHIRWDMRCFTVHCSGEAPGLLWVTPRQLHAHYTLPVAFRKCLDGAGMTEDTLP